MQPRNDALEIPKDSPRYFSIDLDDWRRVQLEGAAAELKRLADTDTDTDTEPDTEPDTDVEAAAKGVAAALRVVNERRHERLTALVVALKPLPKRGLHHFKFPSRSKARAFAAWGNVGNDPGLSLYHSAVVGLFWSHRGTEIDARLPARATLEQWDAYAEAVEDELQDAGYAAQEVTLMGRHCDEVIAGWMTGLTEAKALADFTEVKEV